MEVLDSWQGGQGCRAHLLRFLLFGFLQALEERLFEEVQLLQGHLEEGGHVANEDSGPSIIASCKERKSTGSVQLPSTEMLTAAQRMKPKPQIHPKCTAPRTSQLNKKTASGVEQCATVTHMDQEKGGVFHQISKDQIFTSQSC